MMLMEFSLMQILMDGILIVKKHFIAQYVPAHNSKFPHT